MINGGKPVPLTFSVVPSKLGGVHAVMDWMIRAAYHDPGLVKLRAVCGDEVRPGNRLPPSPKSALCARCREAMPENVAPMPCPDHSTPNSSGAPDPDRAGVWCVGRVSGAHSQ